jgi:hypothetical protein
MDFMNRNSGNNRQSQPAHNPMSAKETEYNQSSLRQQPEPKKPQNESKKFAGLKVAWIILLFTGTILAVAAISAIGLARTKSESDIVKSDQMQAVFLNGGQVYFGRVAELNKQFMQLRDIYYLRVEQQIQPDGQSQSNDISLVKLGCELHGPEDEMVINREHILFWENLKNDGQVARAVAQYIEEFPNGQDCNEQQQQQPQPNGANNTEESAPLLEEESVETNN